MSSQGNPPKKKVETFVLEFDRVEEAFEAGRNMTGRVRLVLKEAMRITRINMHIYGKGKVKWFDSSATGDGADPVYRGQETYINETVHLYESSGSQGDLLPKGEHIYQFDVSLPAHLPSSFEGEFGYVRYHVKSMVISPIDYRRNCSHEKIISISRPLDLNTEPSEVRTTMLAEHERPVSCCCLMSGAVSVRFHLERRGFVPGEDICWKAEIRQSARMSVVKRCSVTLKQFITYTGVSDAFFSSGRPKPHSQGGTVCSTHRSGGRPGEPIIWNGNLTVPALPPSCLDGCRLLSIRYAVQFKAVISFGEDIRIMTDVVIGTVPLVNHFRTPPYHPEATSYDNEAKCATIISSIAPSVNWALPPVSYDLCPIKHGQKKLPDPNGDPSEGVVKFTPRYPVYRSQPLFSGLPRV